MVDVNAVIEGVIFTELRQICDERGAVLHMVRSDVPEFPGFGECYFSEVFPGAVKAWKRHRLQTQTLAVPVGRLRIVLYDDPGGFFYAGPSFRIGTRPAGRLLASPNSARPLVWFLLCQSLSSPDRQLR